MRHPFELELSDLENLSDLDTPKSSTDLNVDSQETEAVRGGRKPLTKALFESGGDDPILTTLAIGEEGGSPCLPTPIRPRPPICRPFPIKPPVKPPIATTQALGEEGGGCFPQLY